MAEVPGGPRRDPLRWPCQATRCAATGGDSPAPPSVTLLLGFLRRRLYAAATVAHGARHGRCKAGGGVAATEIGRDGLARNFRDGLKVTIRAVAQIAGVPEKGVF